jgi:large subunit ribosomal protein L9
MKVVLKKAVLKLGIPGEIVDVKPGYAFNFLIPQGIALFADEQNLANFEAKKAEFLAEHNKSKTIAEAVKNVINGKAVFMEKSVNDAGNFYAVLSAVDVAKELNTQFKQSDFEFNKNQIVMSNKIRNYGIYDFTVILYNGVIAKMKVSIALNKSLAQEAINKPETEKK